jgi:hypothetical protein
MFNTVGPVDFDVPIHIWIFGYLVLVFLIVLCLVISIVLSLLITPIIKYVWLTAWPILKDILG